MRKIFFLFVTLLLWTHPAGLWAQGPDTSAFGKMDALLRLQLRQAGYEEAGGVLKRSALRRSRVQGDTVFRLLVRCADSEALATGLRAEGYEVHPIVPTLCVAASPASRLSRLARYPGVERLCGSRTARPLMDASRLMTGMDRVAAGGVSEIILALNPTMEGDTTNFYIARRLADYDVRLTVLARGVNIGDELEYTDEITLGRSIINRVSLDHYKSKL